MTHTIPAANNLTIQTENGVWRLFNGTTAPPLVEATLGGVTYPSAFARARNLPDGLLPSLLIEMVIVGWAIEDRSWQLGLLLTSDYARERGGRWCGLARWFDTQGALESEAAHTAGKMLAEVLGKPFRFVPAEPAVSAPASALPAADSLSAELLPDSPPLPALPDVQVMTPPIALGEWALTESRTGLNWEHSRDWRLETLGRAVFFGLLTLLFGLLSYGEIRTSFAPVQPDWLPLVGVLVAVIMALNALAHLWALVTTNAVEFDRRNRMIRFVRPPRGVIRQVPFEKVEYVLVSQAINRREPVRVNGSLEPAFDRVLPEVWIHLARAKGDFLEVGHITQTTGRAIHASTPAARHPLRVEEVDTPVHQAGLLLANTMEVPAFIEDRS